MGNGILCFANNNGEIDYCKQAYFLALRVRKYLDLPTSVVTSTPKELEKYSDVFDKIITVNDVANNVKRYSDGQTLHQNLFFKNNGRSNSYNLTPYDKTIVLDTDVIICNSSLLNAFNSSFNFQIYKDCEDLTVWRNHKEFSYINDKGIPFYWATCFYFKKDKEVEAFFTILNHVVNNWDHYQYVYDLGARNFRNDHAFSIAIHIMNGFTDNEWARPLPGRLYYCLDKDILHKLENEKLTFLLQKENVHGEYTVASTTDMNVHVMNKYSLERILNV